MRVAPKITLTAEDRQTLERWSRGRSTPARQVLRAHIVLAAADGKENRAIAKALGTNRRLVGKWRKRFAEQGLAGIAKDAPRGGRKPSARIALAAKIVESTQKKPANATHWSTRTLAKELGTNHALVSRVWRANGLKPDHT
jgi:transposase